MLFLILIPLAIVPLIVIDVVGTGSVVGTGLTMEGEGVGFHQAIVPRGLYAVLVAAEFPDAFDEQLPHAGIGNAVHEVGVGVPVVEITDYGNRFCVRCPNSENNALTAIPVFKV